MSDITDRVREIILRDWGRKTREEVLDTVREIQPDASLSSVGWQAWKLRSMGYDLPYYRWKHGYKTWSNDDHGVLLEMAGNRTVIEIADKLQRSKYSVEQHAKRHGISLRTARNNVANSSQEQ